MAQERGDEMGFDGVRHDDGTEVFWTEPYSTATVRMGILEQELVDVAYMPREDFLELVDDQLCVVGLTDEQRADLRKTAETMPRFPMDDWINSTRGCGCVVGEYLVAQDILSREDVAAGEMSVDQVLIDREGWDGPLNRFGVAIDEAVRDRLYVHDIEGDEIGAVVFLDREES
jgi:hypothetical protein